MSIYDQEHEDVFRELRQGELDRTESIDSPLNSNSPNWPFNRVPKCWTGRLSEPKVIAVETQTLEEIEYIRASKEAKARQKADYEDD